MVGVVPVLYIVCAREVLFLRPGKQTWYVLCWVVDFFCPHHSPQQEVFRRGISVGCHYSGAIDQVDTLHESDILPHFGLARDGSGFTRLLGSKGGDYRAKLVLACVESYTDISA